LAAVGLLLLTGSLGAGEQLYRYIDDDGSVHYSDKIPPSIVPRGHAELAPTGVTIRRVDRAKTREELEREQELERLRDEARALVEAHQAQNRMLLETFRSIDDMIMVRDGKIASIDVAIQVIRRNIRSQQDQVRLLRGDAADLERSGKPVSEQLDIDIAATEQSIHVALAEIARREQEKQALMDSFDEHIERFQTLKNSPRPAVDDRKLTQVQARDFLLGCRDRAECDLYWERAKRYLRQHATLPVEISTPNLEMTRAPESREDISLTLSRLDNETGGGGIIFLDLQCRRYSGDPALCRTDSRSGVLNRFRGAIASPTTAQNGP
jgi:hypothetical protein